LINLVTNAIKFTDRGSVTVDVSATADRVVFTVRDTGIGIAADHIETIFAPFWQVEQSMKRTAGGAGLGLAVTRRFARLLGGDVFVTSEPGAGSTFTLEIPRSLSG
jgi:signal transduction histidine kinase